MFWRGEKGGGVLRKREIALGVGLVLFVLVTTTASVWWGTSPPNTSLDNPPPTAESNSLAGEIPAQHQAVKEVFPIVYAVITVVLVIFVGLLCAANCCWQVLGSKNKSVFSEFQKY